MRRKKVSINNSVDYDKFLKKINIYKSILYHYTYFIVENNIHDEMIEYITNALNIKNRKERLEYVYDKTCEFIDNKNKQINICGFKNGKCYIQRKSKQKNCNGCCRKCLYQSKNGCLTKNVACKLFNCSEVKLRHEVVKYKELKLLRLLSLKNRFIIKSDYFSRREDVLRDLYAYSLIYSTIRIVFRITRNFLIFDKNHKQ